MKNVLCSTTKGSKPVKVVKATKTVKATRVTL